MKQHLEIVAMDLCPTELNQSRTKEACDPERAKHLQSEVEHTKEQTDGSGGRW